MVQGMLLYVLVALLALLLWLGSAWLGADRTRRPITVGLLLLVFVVGVWREAGHQLAEHRYTKVSRALTGIDDVKVRCGRLTDAFFDVGVFKGWVAYGPDGPSRLAEITWDTCRDLRKWERDPDDAEIEGKVAVHVLTHEAMHLAGHTNEAAAECYAVQYDARAAQLLGASRPTAHRLAVDYLVFLYPRMRDDYRSAECVADGTLDLEPGDGTWPVLSDAAASAHQAQGRP